MRPTSPEWATTANLILIAVAMVLTIAAIWWGTRQRRLRNLMLAEREMPADPAADAAAEELAPVAAAIDTRTVAPPVAPAPPRLAEIPSVIVAASAPAASAPAATPAAEGDDLSRLKGVGPKLAARLSELGYARFDQIAGLTPADADALDARLGAFRGRLARDRWIEQAGYLAKGDTAGFEAAFGKL